MDFPDVDLHPGESIYKADERIEEAFEDAGLQLVAFEGYNTFLDTSSACHFFQVPSENGRAVVVVMTSPWEEKPLVTVLNVLLELRLDPDPPGSLLPVRFYSAHEVPGVLRSVFGDSRCCQFECRALLVSRFGHDVRPDLSLQAAAVGAYLVRECFGTQVGFFDVDGAARLEEIILDRFAGDEECSEPINSLIALGFLLGEIVRSRVDLPSAWQAGDNGESWPEVVFSPASDDAASVVCPAISLVIRAFQDRSRGELTRAVDEILRRCETAAGGTLRSDAELAQVREARGWRV